MKLSNYLVEIAGVSIYPIISLLLFVVFFLSVIWWVVTMNKEKVNYISQLPFNDVKENPTNQ